MSTPSIDHAEVTRERLTEGPRGFWRDFLAIPGPGSIYRVAGKPAAGVFSGIWHGAIAGPVLLASALDSRTRMYEEANKGRRYDLGFFLGIAPGGYTIANWREDIARAPLIFVGCVGVVLALRAWLRTREGAQGVPRTG